MKYMVVEQVKNIAIEDGSVVNCKTYKEALENLTKTKEAFMQQCKNDKEDVEILLDNEDNFKASLDSGNTIYSITIIELQ